MDDIRQVRECRVLIKEDMHSLQTSLNGYLRTGWTITQMSTAMGTDASGDYPRPVHIVTVIVERSRPATDEEVGA